MADARKLTMAHMANAVRRQREGEKTDPLALKRDEMRLYSYYKPSLQANNYIIEAKQHIAAPVGTGTQTLDIVNTRVGVLAPQEFEVVVPRFSLDPTLINNYYPPDGHQDEGRVLPHIVLEDPHYPWEIEAGVTETIPEKKVDGKIVQERRTMADKTDVQDYVDPVTKKSGTIYRGMVPWVGLLVFDPEDLHFDDITQLTSLNVPGFAQAVDLNKQNPKGSFTMNISDYFNTIPKSSRINYEAGYFGADGKFDDTAFNELPNSIGTLDVIFPKKDLFTTIFGASDSNRPGVKVGVEAYRYLSHVRHINTTGVPDAGIDEEGLFSVIIASRTGVFDQPAPHTQICHLVSIEHVDSTLGSHLTTDAVSDRVGMVSLFSWIYSALPPNPVNFVDTMRNLTGNQQMLRTDDNVLAKLDAAISAGGDPVKIKATKPLAARLRMGYTLARWRTQSGEQTAAWNRGPLVPQPVSWPGDDDNSDIPDSSKTSQEYQILDPQTGLMDLSYSSAWQAGKLAAISDTVFSGALMRFRSVVHNSSANKTRMQANGMATAEALFVSVGKSVAEVRSLARGDTGDPFRLRAPSLQTPAPDVTHPDMAPIMRQNVSESTKSNAGSGQAIYDEFNLDGPNNSDWAIIHTWMCEKLSLGGIPAQYLIPEPAFIRPESLRFFHIDDFWLDCFLDGALSVANHLDRDDDLVRREIKETFNSYLGKIVEHAKIIPQIPSYGFIIRSKLIKAMPDLIITVTWKVPDDRHPVCRWTQWDDETLLCLLDRQPDELDSIRLAQPPHQQRYSLGSHVDKTGVVTFDLRRLYTQGAPEEWAEKPFSTVFSPRTDPSTWLDAPSRCLNISKMATEINRELQFGTATDTEAYIDPKPNSCELGLELNDPSYFFSIVPPVHTTRDPRKRQLYVRQPKAVSNPPAPMLLQAATFARSPMVTVQTASSAPQAAKTAAAQSSLPGPSLNSTAPNRQVRMQPQPVSLATAVSRIATGPGDLQSQFFLTIFADSKDMPNFPRTPGPRTFQADDYIPSATLFFYDIIFSIRNKGNKVDYSLLRIDIDIPVTTTPNPSKTNPTLLTANYDGPGLRMLSNQRFIPFLFAPDESLDKPFLHIELIPRSANLDFIMPINDSKTAELDFRLAEANVSPMLVKTLVDVQGQANNVPRERVVVTMTEWYKTSTKPQGVPVTTPYVLLKWDEKS